MRGSGQGKRAGAGKGARADHAGVKHPGAVAESGARVRLWMAACCRRVLRVQLAGGPGGGGEVLPARTSQADLRNRTELETRKLLALSGCA